MSTGSPALAGLASWGLTKGPLQEGTQEWGRGNRHVCSCTGLAVLPFLTFLIIATDPIREPFLAAFLPNYHPSP